MKRIPDSKAIKKVWLDFGDGASYAQKHLHEVTGLAEMEMSWKGTRLYFITESIRPKVQSPTRPRVLLLFSNPLPESINNRLFMSEKHSRRFWEILCSNKQLGITHDFKWDSEGIKNTVTLLLNGNYGNDKSPLLFFECLYPIPSRSPKDLKKLFRPRTDDFRRYLHRPSLARIGTILNKYDIGTTLVFTGETFESITGKPGAAKGSRRILFSSVKAALDKDNSEVFWKCMEKHKLIERTSLPNVRKECIAIKIMDTRAKDWWPVRGRPTFSHVLDLALKYASSKEGLPRKTS